MIALLLFVLVPVSLCVFQVWLARRKSLRPMLRAALLWVLPVLFFCGTAYVVVLTPKGPASPWAYPHDISGVILGLYGFVLFAGTLAGGVAGCAIVYMDARAEKRAKEREQK